MNRSILALIAAAGLSVGWVDQDTVTGTPSTNAALTIFSAPRSAGKLYRVIWTVPKNGTNMTVVLSELNGVSILSSNIALPATNAAFTITWETNLVHGRYAAYTKAAGWTNLVDGGVTSAVIPAVSVELLEEK